MEKLRSLRKQRGFSQEKMAGIIATDPSNYSRKERGEIKMFDDEWEKLAAALEVPVEEIKEERLIAIVHNNHDSTTFNGNSGSYFNNFTGIPNSIVENLQSYIKILEEKIVTLKEENEKLKE
ncbi:helix-turn-helix domain-containing protein [Chryseobacterium populi]|nr:helix-turn-helix transcriptional regulator [Chryseobacterium populi]